MRKTTYQICSTSNPNHLNGTIEIVDNGNDTGEATIIVWEKQLNDRMVLSNSTEDIKLNGDWRTSHPHHKTYDNKMQTWIFEVDRANPNRDYDHDNGGKYNQYIEYELKRIGVYGEGDGSGTAGGN